MRSKMKRVLAILLVVPALASSSFAFTFGAAPAEARRHILAYAREYPASPEHPVTRRRFVLRTVRRALGGDFQALDLVLGDKRFGSGDNSASLPMEGEFLTVLGDKQYAAFVLSHPAGSRWRLLDLAGPFGREEAELRRDFPTVAKLSAEFYLTHQPQSLTTRSSERPLRGRR